MDMGAEVNGSLVHFSDSAVQSSLINDSDEKTE